MKTLAIITRVHPKRPNMLRICKESVKRQSCQDYEHLFIYDPTESGYGMLAANKSFARQLVKIGSRYVMVLDDDNILVDDNLVKDIKEIEADMIIFRGIVEGLPWPVLPPDDLWEKPIVCNHIDAFCVAVSRELWEQYKAHFGKASGGGDFHFMKAAFDHAENIYWHDKVVAETQRVSKGRAE